MEVQREKQGSLGEKVGDSERVRRFTECRRESFVRLLIAKKYRAVRLAAVLSIVSLGVVLAAQARYEIPNDDGTGGPWLNWQNSPSCSEGTLCAEWPNENINIVVVCCISPEAVATYDYGGCETFLFQRPLA